MQPMMQEDMAESESQDQGGQQQDQGGQQQGAPGKDDKVVEQLVDKAMEYLDTNQERFQAFAEYMDSAGSDSLPEAIGSVAAKLLQKVAPGSNADSSTLIYAVAGIIENIGHLLQNAGMQLSPEILDSALDVAHDALSKTGGEGSAPTMADVQSQGPAPGPEQAPEQAQAA